MGLDPGLARGLGLRLIASAVLSALAFPPFHLGPTILVALVPFFDAVRLAEAATRGRRAASALLFLGGALHFAVLLYWILFLPPEETTVPGIIVVAFALMVAYLGLYLFLAQWAARRAARAGVPIELALALAWVGAEYLRSQTQLAFPWVLLGYGLIETPVFLQFMSATGIFGASLLVALVNAALLAGLRRRGRARAGWLLTAAALPALAFLQGSWVMSHLPPAPTREVLIVQGNIGREIKFKPEYRTSNLERLIALSREGLAQGSEPPALIVWAETAAPCYVRRDPICRERLEAFVDEVQVPLLTGTPDLERLPDGTRRYANAAVVLTPGEGLTASYAKVKLVPFGEAIPYQERLPWLARLDFGEADFLRGQGFTPVAVGQDTAGIMICFESIFPAVGRAYANHGARYLVNITNDEWFGKSGGPYQHAQMAVARAIETRRGLVRCANTGVSFVVDRKGQVTHATELFQSAVVRAPVELGSGQTIYARIGDVVPALVLAASALGAVAGAGGLKDPRLTLLAVLLGGLLAFGLPAHAAIALALGLLVAQSVIPAWRPGRRSFYLAALGLAAFTLVLNALTVPGRALWSLGPLRITAEGLAAGCWTGGPTGGTPRTRPDREPGARSGRHRRCGELDPEPDRARDPARGRARVGTRARAALRARDPIGGGADPTRRARAPAPAERAAGAPRPHARPGRAVLSSTPGRHGAPSGGSGAHPRCARLWLGAAHLALPSWPRPARLADGDRTRRRDRPRARAPSLAWLSPHRLSPRRMSPRRSRFGIDSTSSTTAPTSPAGKCNRGSGPCRGWWRRSSAG